MINYFIWMRIIRQRSHEINRQWYFNQYMGGYRWIIDDVPQRPINIELMINLNLKVSSLITTHGECDLQLLNE